MAVTLFDKKRTLNTSEGRRIQKVITVVKPEKEYPANNSESRYLSSLGYGT